MRLRLERDRGGYLARVFAANYGGEVAYAYLGLRGPKAEIEFPTRWHEESRVWVRLGCGCLSLNFSFPWKQLAPDHGQCSGPTYGFYFFADHLVLQWGQDTGRSSDAKTSKFIYMPWSWKHRKHEVLTEKETHPYRYLLDNGDVQCVSATIYKERRKWTRRWLPWSKVSTAIWVEFDKEVGERTGSWKGGVTGCGYEMKLNETPKQTLRRMERERIFK